MYIYIYSYIYYAHVFIIYIYIIFPGRQPLRVQFSHDQKHILRGFTAFTAFFTHQGLTQASI